MDAIIQVTIGVVLFLWTLEIVGIGPNLRWYPAVVHDIITRRDKRG